MNRSCEFCESREKNKNLLGEFHWCVTKSEEIKLNGYCNYFKQKKTK